jgi:hypothetical protein
MLHAVANPTDLEIGLRLSGANVVIFSVLYNTLVGAVLGRTVKKPYCIYMVGPKVSKAFPRSFEERQKNSLKIRACFAASVLFSES